MLVSVFNYKGGVGKSTITMLSAVLLKAAGYSVAVFDADVQESICENENFDVGTLQKIKCKDAQCAVAKLKKIAQKVDFLLVDTPPRGELLSYVRAAEKHIVVSSASTLAAKATCEMLEKINNVNAFLVLNAVAFNTNRKMLTLIDKCDAEFADKAMLRYRIAIEEFTEDCNYEKLAAKVAQNNNFKKEIDDFKQKLIKYLTN